MSKIAFFIERVFNYFEKEVYVDIEYLHSFEDEVMTKTKDAFSISICQKGKCESHFGKIPWEDACKVLNVLKESKGKVLLSVSVGMGESNILIPKWAKPILIEKLEKE